MITPLMAFTSFSSMLSAILIVAPILVTAQPYQNVTLGSQIVAGENVTWLSPSGDFAFGFQEIIPGRYLLAIWFNRIPERTIVWSANRDNLVGERSTINLLQGGRFELHNPNARQPIWNADSTISAYGAMLDNGNFVLANSRSIVVWQSFDHPTDTILPGQTINQGGALVSSFSNTNYSRGRFRYDLQASGNFVLSTRSFPTDGIVNPYNTTTAGVGSQVIFNQSGYIFLASTTTNETVMLSSNAGPTTQLYHRAMLEYDGVFRHYVYPRSANSTSGGVMQWSVQQFWPLNICSTIQENIGPGACGFNSYCSMGDDQRPRCYCPNSYSPVDPNDWMSGCKPDFAPHSCENEMGVADNFNLIDMPNTNFPLNGIDYVVYVINTDLEQCRHACLVDCFCALATYDESLQRCWKKRFPLSNGRSDLNEMSLAMIKIRINNITATNPRIQQQRRDPSTLIIVGSVSLGSLLFLNLLFLVIFFVCFYKRKSKKAQVSSVVFQGLPIRSFSFAELQKATSGFNELLGSGAISTVYKGVLKNENGKQIAVKRLGEIARGAEKEFKAEVSAIIKTNHRNLVQLLGCCDEGQHKLLVYEFMCNGDLSNFLVENSSPGAGWHTRARIGVAVANGICYLHEECSTQIIHCDIKPQNILLDEALNAKVSDFGLAKLLMPDQTRTTTGIRGTRGYVAPEWFRNMPITTKVDVYSFGILLLELICCRRNVKKEVQDEREEILAYWAYDCYKEGTVNVLVPAHDEEAMNDFTRFTKFVMIAIWCIQEDPSLRPNMKKVLHMLEGSVEVPIPSDPESFRY